VEKSKVVPVKVEEGFFVSHLKQLCVNDCAVIFVYVTKSKMQ
jgi:hypothetical protein